MYTNNKKFVKEFHRNNIK